MTTIAPNRIEELAELERAAWSGYRESLRDLDGRAYEEAEAVGWEELQRRLADLEAQRAGLAEAIAP